MADIIELWPRQAMDKAMKALTEFENTGNRAAFKKWSKEYSEKIVKEKEKVINILKGEKPMNNYTPVDDMKRDAAIMDQDKWYEKHGGELWIIYHEEGANYDTDYDDWCEKKYDSMKDKKDKNMWRPTMAFDMPEGKIS